MSAQSRADQPSMRGCVRGVMAAKVHNERRTMDFSATVRIWWIHYLGPWAADAARHLGASRPERAAATAARSREPAARAGRKGFFGGRAPAQYHAGRCLMRARAKAGARCGC